MKLRATSQADGGGCDDQDGTAAIARAGWKAHGLPVEFNVAVNPEVVARALRAAVGGQEVRPSLIRA
jgi:isoleucyl-tRNA synthetase